VKLLLICGSWGSGTSAVAGFIECLGAIGFGPYFFTRDPRTRNSYEFLPFSELVGQFISLAPLSVIGDKLAQLESDLIQFRRRIEAQEFGAYDPTGDIPIFLKCPSASLIVPEICEVFETKIVLVVRTLEEIEQTRVRREWPEVFGRAGAEVVYKELSRILRTGDYPYMTIEYGEFLMSPSHFADRLAQFGGLRPAAEAVRRAVLFVRSPSERSNERPHGGAIPVACKQRGSAEVTLLSAPLELGGAWQTDPPRAAARVANRIRDVLLSGLRLLSDQQPLELRVTNRSNGPPAILLQSADRATASILVNTGDPKRRDWCKLAYQLGHELGHILCNSWRSDARPRLPSQWIEEALVEAFSIEGLAMLATSWAHDPPFSDDSAFGTTLMAYRQNLIEKYQLASERFTDGCDLSMWYHNNETRLETIKGVSVIQAPAVMHMVKALHSDWASAEDMGALNRWPERSGIPLADYLVAWDASCNELSAAGRLLSQVKAMFQPTPHGR
jgi:hypothetical protein